MNPLIIIFNPRSADAKHRIPNSILQIGASIHGTYHYEFIDGNLEDNPEKNKEYLANYRKNNPEKVKALYKKWREANPEKYRKIMSVAGKKWRMKNAAKLKKKSLREVTDLRKKKSLW